MYQSLLKERFKLVDHWTVIQATTYELVSGDHGAKLHPATSADNETMSVGQSHWEAKAYQLSGLSDQLSLMVGGVVSDRTGLPGRYDFNVHWTRDEIPKSNGSGSSPDAGLTLREALEDKYGLKLVPHKGQISAIVIDHIERPSPN